MSLIEPALPPLAAVSTNPSPTARPGSGPPPGSGLRSVSLPRLNVWTALIVVALVLAASLGVQYATARPANAVTTQQEESGNLVCGLLPVLSEPCNELLDSAAWAGEGLGGVGETVVAGAFDFFAQWVAVGAIGAIDLVWVGINGTTTPTVDSNATVFRASLNAAQALALPLLVMAALYSLLKRDAGIAVKAALLYLPGSVLGMVVAGFIINALLQATDQLSAAYLDTGQTDVAQWLDGVGGVIAAGVGITAPILLVIFSLVLIIGSILLWLVMIVRSAAILITYAFMPLAFAAMIFPATRGWIRRLIEIQLSFILAKPVIVAVLALGSQTLNDNENALVAMMQAAALFYLAAFAPFALMKLLPFVGDEAVAAMEEPSGAPGRALATAAGVVGGARLAGFLMGSQQDGPPAASASPGAGGGGIDNASTGLDGGSGGGGGFDDGGGGFDGGSGGGGGPDDGGSGFSGGGGGGGASPSPSPSSSPSAGSASGGGAGGRPVDGGGVSGGSLPGGSADAPTRGNDGGA
ncbi:MAG: hypothetical protein AAF467_03420 [Actinomycetota bacterium]